MEAIQRVNAERRAAPDGARGLGRVAADERRQRGIVEQPFEVAVEELRLRIALERVLETASEVDITEGQRAVLGDRRGEDVDLLVAEHVAEADFSAAEYVAVAGDADVHRRTPLEEHLLERLLLALIGLDQGVRERRLEVDDRTGLAEVRRGGGVQRLLAIECMDAHSLVVGDERNVAAGRVVQHDWREDAAERVRVLAELAVAQVQRPDVEDVAVLGRFGVERNRRIGRG
jgi:hypothetical protein